MSTLKGKVALVTGASRGIGASIAKRLGRDGASVAITYGASREKADEVVKSIEASGSRALAIKADNGDPQAVKSAVAQTVAQLGRLDILVNNAGIVHVALVGDFPEDQFERMLSVNVRGAFAATREAVKHMGEGGRIINIGSINSDLITYAGGSIYSLTKGAIAGFTHGLARELGPRGITVNNLQPGPVDTDMNPEEGGQFSASVKPLIALRRYGKVDEVAGLVSFLAGPEGAFITGANLRIDGGLSA